MPMDKTLRAKLNKLDGKSKEQLFDVEIRFISTQKITIYGPGKDNAYCRAKAHLPFDAEIISYSITEHKNSS